MRDIKLLSKTKAKEIKSLSLKKERDREGLFIAEGEKCVRDLLEAFPLKYLVATAEWIENNQALQNKYTQELLVTDKRGLEIISSLNSVPDVIAVFYKRKDKQSLPKIDPEKLYILLDEIQDPGNLGTIIRTADWFGVYDIFASGNTVDVYSGKVVQSTMGSLSRVRIHYTDLKLLIENNPEVKVIGTLLTGEPYRNVRKKTGGFLLMGNEGRGISEELKKMIDLPLTIPPVNKESHPDSLNVSIATAILLSHLTEIS